MKKLIIFLLVFISCYGAIGQAISDRGSKTLTVRDYRWMGGLNAFIPVYLDTSAASNPTALGIDSCGAIIFTYDENAVWYRGCSPKRWLRMGSGQIINDTIYTEIPIAVKTDSLGRRIIYFLKERGLISGGVLTLDSCMTLGLNATVFNVGYIQYTTAQISGVVVPPADVSFGRIDRIVVDTNLNLIDIPGMPSSTPVPPNYNTFSQFEIAQISVPQNATCLPIGVDIIYDQNTGPPEWTVTSSGTITYSATNTDNPFHLTRAIYISSYTNGSSLIFTRGSVDTITLNDILKMFLYFNGAFLNQMSGTWYNGSTAVSNTISLNQFINPNDSNRYQNLSAILSAWNFTSTAINRFVITFGGDDTTGAKGLYVDYAQLQRGVNNITQGDFVDSVFTRNDSLFQYKHGIEMFRGTTSGGGGSVTADNGLTVNTGSNVQLGGTLLQPTGIDVQAYHLDITTSDAGATAVGTGGLFRVTATGAQDNGGATAASIYNNVVNNGVNYGLVVGATNANINIGLEASGDYTAVDANSPGIAVNALATGTGNGVVATAVDGYAGVFQQGPASTNTIVPTILLARGTQGTAANGMGQSLDFSTQTNGGAVTNITNQIISKLTDAIGTSITSQFSITGIDNAVTDTLLTLSGSGAAQLNQYGDGTFTGTATYCAAFDATGHIIEVACGGGGSNTIYTANDALVSNRSVDLNSKSLSFKQGGNSLLTIDPVGFVTDLIASDGVATSEMTLVGDNTGGNVLFDLNVQNGANNAEITGDAVNNSITYTSGAHTFTGDIILNSIASGATTDSVLTINPTTKKTTWRNPSTFGTTYSGTGYLKLSGTTPSFITTIPIADGGTNNGSLSVTAGTVYYGDGTKLVGLAPGTTKQHLVGGTTPSWKDTTAAFSLTGSTGDLISFSGTNTSSNISAVAAGSILVSAGTSALPAWSASPSLTTSLTVPLINIPTAGTGIASYNTVDQTTNYERVRQAWSGNVFNVLSEKGGTGTLRDININGTAFSGAFQGVVTTGTLILTTIQSQTSGLSNLSFRSAKTNFGNNTFTPTAVIHIQPSTATATTGQLKLDAGTPTTTPEAGLLNNSTTQGLVFDPSTSVRAVVGLWAYIGKTASYTATITDYTIDFTSNTDTLTLPTATGITGRVYIVINSTVASICVVQSTGGQVIGNGGAATNQNIPFGSSLTLQSTGTAWRLL